MMWPLLCAFIGCLVVWALSEVPAPDDTDPPAGRSGMALLIDAGTGCHYLARSFAGITPVSCRPSGPYRSPIHTDSSSPRPPSPTRIQATARPPPSPATPESTATSEAKSKIP